MLLNVTLYFSKENILMVTSNGYIFIDGIDKRNLLGFIDTCPSGVNLGFLANILIRQITKKGYSCYCIIILDVSAYMHAVLVYPHSINDLG